MENPAQPTSVPQRLTSPINHKVFLLILGLVAGFQLYLYSLPDPEEADTTISVISTLNPLAAAVVGFFVARRYQGSKVFGKSYFALALGLSMMVLGEITYGIQDLLGIDPYPSVADVFFISFYPLAFYHLVTNIRFFKPKFDIATKIFIVIIPILIVTIYSFLSFQEIGEANFDYYFGLVFIIASAVVLSAGILGARVFRQGVLGVAWLVLVIGILLTTFGDVWYYYLETFGQYDLIHPVNLFWYTSYMVIAYALYKHQNIV